MDQFTDELLARRWHNAISAEVVRFVLDPFAFVEDDCAPFLRECGTALAHHAQHAEEWRLERSGDDFRSTLMVK